MQSLAKPAEDARKVVVRLSRADEVYEILKQDIADFRLVPGDRFTELDLCDRLQVSRTPLRQALYRLQQEGYVEVLFRSGWRALPFDFDKFEQLYDLRIVLEGAAIARICQAPHEAAPFLEGLEAIWLVPADQRCTDEKQVARWDEAFHCSLVAAAGNAEMARVHASVTERIRIIRRLDFTQPARIDATYDEHAKILQALRSNRADAAEFLLRSHIQTSQSEVRKITLHQVHLVRQGSADASAKSA